MVVLNLTSARQHQAWPPAIRLREFDIMRGDGPNSKSLINQEREQSHAYRWFVTAGYDDGWRASFIRSDVHKLDVSSADCMMPDRGLLVGRVLRWCGKKRSGHLLGLL